MKDYKPRPKTLKILSDIIARVGDADTVLSKDLSTKERTAMHNYAETVQYGVFDVAGLRDRMKQYENIIPVPEEVNLETTADNAIEQEVNDLKNSARPKRSTSKPIEVPECNPEYINDSGGCFGPVRQILKSGEFCPMFIYGPTGNGKTMAIEEACAVEDRPLLIFNIIKPTDEHDLIGSLILDNNSLHWEDGPVLRAYRQGAVLCLDEIDQGTVNLMCLQTILERKPYYVKKTGETVYPADGFMIFATANTNGKGDDSDDYAGVEIMNEAFLERFPGYYEQKYPIEAVEVKALKQFIDEKDARMMVRWANKTRSDVQSQIVSPITTRRLVQIAKMVKIFGGLKEALTLGINRFNEAERKAYLLLLEAVEEESVDPNNNGIGNEAI